MNTRTQNATRISILVRPRFSLLHALVVALLLAAAVIGGRMLNKQPVPPAMSQAESVITLDPSMIDTGPNAWIVNPLRVACAEWNSDDSRYVWLTGPLKERGLTPSDVLEFCERLIAAE